MNDPGEPGNPLQGLLGDLLKLIGSAPGGSTAWLEAARALAQNVATEGDAEANPDPIERIRLEELVRAAELHVADATGLTVGSARSPDRLAARGPWPLGPHGPRLVDPADGTDGGHAGPRLPAPADRPRPHTRRRGAGGAAGAVRHHHGAGAPRHAVRLGRRPPGPARPGRYALPLPWADHGDLVIVPANIAAFAEDWSLPVDQAQLWVCIRELVADAVLGLPQVAARITELLEAATTDAVAAQQGLAERLGADADDPLALQNLLSDPESLLADLLTPGQQRTSNQLVAVTTAFGAYVDHTTARVATSLVGSTGALTEAWYRYRTTEAAGEQAAGALLGLDLGREQVDRGAAFVRGVVERAGEEGLARLWESGRTLPTPAEVDAQASGWSGSTSPTRGAVTASRPRPPRGSPGPTRGSGARARRHGRRARGCGGTGGRGGAAARAGPTPAPGRPR